MTIFIQNSIPIVKAQTYTDVNIITAYDYLNNLLIFKKIANEYLEKKRN